ERRLLPTRRRPRPRGQAGEDGQGRDLPPLPGDGSRLRPRAQRPGDPRRRRRSAGVGAHARVSPQASGLTARSVIALLGATGYTGKLVAAELTKRQLPHRLGGRSPEKLAALPSDAERFVVDAGEPARLDAFLDGATALITTVGPFARLGMPVVEAVVRNQVPYVDSTGEQPFISDVYQRFAD